MMSARVTTNVVDAELISLHLKHLKNERYGFYQTETESVQIVEAIGIANGSFDFEGSLLY